MRPIIFPYLTFNGTCREAMQFYKKCLGGVLYFQAIGSSGKSKAKIPRRMSNCILHAALVNGPFKLMGSDIVGNEGLLKGNTVSISLQDKRKSSVEKYFKNLSQGGRNLNPIRKTEWGTYFGSLTDKFDNHWLFTCNPKAKKK